MRKLILSLALLTFVFGGVAFAVDTPTAPGIIKRQIGTSQDTDVKVYKLVRNSAASPNVNGMSADLCVVYDTNSDDGVSVRTTTTSCDPAIAGIVVTSIPTSDNISGTTAADDAGRRNWGYILVHGRTTALASDGSTNGNSVGDRFVTSSDAGGVCTFASSVFTVGTSSSAELNKAGASGGFFYDAATAGSTSVEVQVELE